MQYPSWSCYNIPDSTSSFNSCVAVLPSRHLAYAASAPPEKKIVLLQFYSSYCSLLLSCTGLWSLPVTANVKTQPNLPQKSFSGGSLVKQLGGIPKKSLLQGLQPLQPTPPCTSQKATICWPRCRNTGGQLHHRWCMFSPWATEALAGASACMLQQFSKRWGQAWLKVNTKPRYTSSH